MTLRRPLLATLGLLLVTLGLALVTISRAARADGAAAQLRGYTEINRILKERVIYDNGFELGHYLGEDVTEPYNGTGLTSLLGTYLGSDTDAGYRNGDPNSINLVLWYLALNGVAQDIAAACSVAQTDSPPDNVFSTRPGFRAALSPLCAWPAGSAKTDDALYGFWSALLGFDAPPEEFAAWKTFVTGSPDLASAPASRAIPAMALAALFNPYFLLRN